MLVLESLLPFSRLVGSKQLQSSKRCSVDAVHETLVLLAAPFNFLYEGLGVPTHVVQVKVEPGHSELMEDIVTLCCQHALLEHLFTDAGGTQLPPQPMLSQSRQASTGQWRRLNFEPSATASYL